MSFLKSKTVLYKEFGDPRKVLKLETLNVPRKLQSGQVLVKWLASPINPLDINRIQGAYAFKEELPAIGGSEGVGRVLEVGPDCTVKTGALVTLFGSKTPFWTQYGIADEDDLFELDGRMDIETAATFMVNPPTAWVMLRDFVNLERGDYIIQNSANSGVGRCVIQLCKAWGIKSVNLVRDRPNIDMLKSELWRLGADHVFTEDEFYNQGRQFMKSLPAPRLALSGVGGLSTRAISSVLARSGGMSKKPHEFTTSALVFKNIKVIGVAIGMWMRQTENGETFKKCMEELQSLAIQKKLLPPPLDTVYLEQYSKAMERSMDSKRNKQLLILHNDNAKL